MWARFVEHRPHHLVSAPRYPAGSVDLAGLVLGGCQSKHRPDGLGAPKACRHIDGGAIGQRHHRANTGDRHQAPAHIIISHDGQQAAVQDADLLAKRTPDNEQRLDHQVTQGTAFGDAQCDQHNRNRNDEAAARMAGAHTKLVMKFSPFIRLSDEKLEPVKLMETVADRLWLAAKRERQRRADVCPEGFEHLMEGAIKQ